MAGDDTYTFGAIIACAVPLVLMCTSEDPPGTALSMPGSFYLPKADINNDGNLSLAEWVEFVSADSGKEVSTFNEVDKDGSGDIDAAEFEHFLAVEESSRSDVFSLVDTNNDGKVTANEYALVSQPTKQGLPAMHQDPADFSFVLFFLYAWPTAGALFVGGEFIGFSMVFLATEQEQRHKDATSAHEGHLMAQLAFLYFVGLFSAMAGPLYAIRALVTNASARMLLVLSGGFSSVYLSTVLGKKTLSDDERMALVREWLGEDLVKLAAGWAHWLMWGGHRGGGRAITEAQTARFFCISVTDTLSLSGTSLPTPGITPSPRCRTEVFLLASRHYPATRLMLPILYSLHLPSAYSCLPSLLSALFFLQGC
jgi:hypothetical protein